MSNLPSPSKAPPPPSDGSGGVSNKQHQQQHHQQHPSSNNSATTSTNNMLDIPHASTAQSGFYTLSEADMLASGPSVLPHSASSMVSAHQVRSQFRVSAAIKRAEQSMLSILAEASNNSIADHIAAMLRDPLSSNTLIAQAITLALGINNNGSSNSRSGSGNNRSNSEERKSSEERSGATPGGGAAGTLSQSASTSMLAGPNSAAQAAADEGEAFMSQIKSLAELSPGSSAAHSPAPQHLVTFTTSSSAPNSPVPDKNSDSNLDQHQAHQHQQQQPCEVDPKALDALHKVFSHILPLFRGYESAAAAAASGLGSSQSKIVTASGSGGSVTAGTGGGGSGGGGIASANSTSSFSSSRLPNFGKVTTGSSSGVPPSPSVTSGRGGALQSAFPSAASMKIVGGGLHTAPSAMQSIYNARKMADLAASISQQQQQHHGSRSGGMTTAASTISNSWYMNDSIRSVSRAAVSHTTNVIETNDGVGMRFVNQYMMLESIGAGAQGEVFCCLDTATNEYRAVKVMPRPRPASLTSTTGGTGTMAARALRESMETAQRLANEVKILSRCRHPAVVQLFDFIDDASRDEVFLVMQYVEHGPLLHCDNEGNASRTFSLEKFLNYARQICSGLAYLHRRGITHRDIRGENVLVGSLDRVCLADFGVSDMWAGLDTSSPGDDGDGDGAEKKKDSDGGEDNSLLATTQTLLQTLQNRIAAVYGTGRRCGTTAFLAPELLSDSGPSPLATAGSSSFLGNDDDDGPDGAALQAADVWATGLLFHLMLYGRLPFNCSSAAEYIENIVNSPFELPRTTTVIGREGEPEIVPRSIRIILSRMLHRDPAFRASIADVRAAFKEVVRQREEAEHDPRTPSRSRRDSHAPSTGSSLGNTTATTTTTAAAAPTTVMSPHPPSSTHQPQRRTTVAPSASDIRTAG